MKLTIVTTVLFGLLLAPALAQYFQNQQNQLNREININGLAQLLNINRELQEIAIEQRNELGGWRTIWNYGKGYVGTELYPERTCYISPLDRSLFPSFETFPTYLEGFQGGLKGQIQPTREITYLLGQRLVPQLGTYGPGIFNMCRAVTSIGAIPVPEYQNIYNEGACSRLNVLNLLGLNYCRGNIKV